jgi:hypothetical protein
VNSSLARISLVACAFIASAVPFTGCNLAQKRDVQTNETVEIVARHENRQTLQDQLNVTSEGGLCYTMSRVVPVTKARVKTEVSGWRRCYAKEAVVFAQLICPPVPWAFGLEPLLSSDYRVTAGVVGWFFSIIPGIMCFPSYSGDSPLTDATSREVSRELFEENESAPVSGEITIGSTAWTPSRYVLDSSGSVMLNGQEVVNLWRRSGNAELTITFTRGDFTKNWRVSREQLEGIERYWAQQRDPAYQRQQAELAQAREEQAREEAREERRLEREREDRREERERQREEERERNWDRFAQGMGQVTKNIEQSNAAAAEQRARMQEAIERARENEAQRARERAQEANRRQEEQQARARADREQQQRLEQERRDQAQREQREQAERQQREQAERQREADERARREQEARKAQEEKAEKERKAEEERERPPKFVVVIWVNNNTGSHVMSASDTEEENRKYCRQMCHWNCGPDSKNCHEFDVVRKRGWVILTRGGKKGGYTFLWTCSPLGSMGPESHDRAKEFALDLARKKGMEDAEVVEEWMNSQ